MAINKFLLDKMNNALEGKHSRNYLNKTANMFYKLNSFGIDNDKDLVKYHYLSQYIPVLVKRVYGRYNEQISNNIIRYALNKIDNRIYDENIVDIACEAFTKMQLVKTAYPNFDSDIAPIKDYNMAKWINALNDIYVRTRMLNNRKAAFEQVTSQWSDMQEKRDFERWVKFYEKGGTKLYKSAQSYSGLPLQAIPGLSRKDEMPEIASDMPDIKRRKKNEELTLKEIKDKVLSRISSAKKILSDNSSKLPDYQRFVDVLLSFEKDVLNIRTASMLNDVFYRARNTLQKTADNESVELFVKIAQLPTLPDMGMGGAPTDPNAAGGAAPQQGGTPEDGEKAIDGFRKALGEIIPAAKSVKIEPETKGSPAPTTSTPTTGAQPTDAAKQPGTPAKPEEQKPGTSAAPATPAKPATPAPAKPATPAAPAAPAASAAPTTPTAPTAKTSSRYNWAVIDTPEVKYLDSIVNNILKIATAAKSHLYVTAQIAPPVATPAPAPVAVEAPPAAAEITTEPEEPKEEPLTPVATPSDAKLLNIDNDPLEAALNNIKLSDVIKRMQALSRVFKNREIARQLSIIDIMLDKLGISGFFPSLAEATRSALESNQYCQTRVEEVLSKLISATDEKGLPLVGTTTTQTDKGSIVDREMKEYMQEKPSTTPKV